VGQRLFFFSDYPNEVLECDNTRYNQTGFGVVVGFKLKDATTPWRDAFEG
jgi:hypothetical protein